ncbi:S-layer protein SlpA [Clostridioides difficile]|uniref:S-layer protein SlpA n=1 Tax=Clostridioides difficile TaxID=1496 RepID=UPI001C1753F9|nr:S-layer protein SlpA [Clostridioides difficile]MDF3816240.1 S-layer protein SlpA [Clostridioides difficile]HBF4283760.1 S-layer protein SlpA [Clostridioides difficile]HBF5047324.1 S-layer protein SlpA [Clostridioides difficile]HBF5113961.1 S-layer protein SlpA [Clostridioides difficile]HBF5875600.1 S-layer protein SlpA [Clostridioides difficile]
MNKKNLAMAMAAVTVVGSAAPIFADTTVKEEGYTVVQDKYEKLLKELKAKIKDGTITSVGVEFDGKPITTLAPKADGSDKDAIAEQLETLTKNQLKGLGDGKYVDFKITYGAKAEVPAASLSADDIQKYADQINASEKILVEVAAESKAGIAKFDSANNKVIAGDAPLKVKDAVKATVTTNSGKKVLTISAADGLSGFSYGTLKDTGASSGDVVAITLDTTNATITEGDTKVLDFDNSFKFNENTKKVGSLVTTNTTNTPADPGTKTTVRVIKAVEKTIDVSSSSTTKAKDLAKQYVFKDGDAETPGNLSYMLKYINDEDKKVAVKNNDGDYEVTIFPEGKRLNTLSASSAKTILGEADAPAKIVLKASSTKKLADYIDDLITYNNSYSNVQTVAGSDRIETAIELSRKYYNSTDKNALYGNPVNNVVLVGSQAIVDGLVASPLAAEKDAPLLLSSKDKLDSSTRAEIKRVMDLNSSTGIKNNKEVFIAGGVNSISKDVENELKDMGLKVTRLSGDDRYETSLAIADEIDINDKAYVVGGTGLADAMSIAPVASQIKDGEATPIVVVDGKSDKLSKEAEDFLDDAQVDIIGGENSVSAKMEDYIDDATGKSPERISGADRQATNAEVIKEYFDKDKVSNYFLAKDGSTKEDQLVDALAAAAVAGNYGSKHNEDGDITTDASPAPIILATDNLSAEQHVAVSKTSNSDVAKNLVQVGQGIADSVVSKLKDLLDM